MFKPKILNEIRIDTNDNCMYSVDSVSILSPENQTVIYLKPKIRPNMDIYRNKNMGVLNNFFYLTLHF